MELLALGCSYRNTAVEVREKLAFTDEQAGRALDRLASDLGYEAVILSTCNRVELYLARSGPCPLGGDLAGFLADFHGVPADRVRPHVYAHRQLDAVRHLFRVSASLDSMLIGEGQIAGQVKKAFDRAMNLGATGPVLNVLFMQARKVAKRVRTDTGISQGHVSVSSAAVDYVREVFDHFGDKTVLVIGAGKMGELTLKHLAAQRPARILVTNRSPEKAFAVAAGCGGEAVPWDRLDEVLAQAHIVLSTTGAPEPIVTLERYRKIPRRHTVAILDIAVPRDFDPRIHDGDQTFLFNIDDLRRSQEATLSRRREHVAPAEAIVEAEAQKFVRKVAENRVGPVIDRLTKRFEEKRREVVANLFARLNGKLTDGDRQYIEKAFHIFQSQFLHGPISVLKEETASTAAGRHTLLEALRKLFHLPE
ncbi:MAG: glutamyl-tRNA reductase [Gemmataceae bacterium]